MVYYRTEWTCGRFNKLKKVALMYNLIEGMSYFFEDMSAEVIGVILSSKRNTEIDINVIANVVSLDISTIVDFLNELVSLGLLATSIPTSESILNYRKQVGMINCQQELTMKKMVHEKRPYELDDAERSYADAIGEDAVVNVMFELTYNCSEKCIHCYNPGATRNNEDKSQRRNRKELSLVDYKRIIDELNNLGVFKVCLSGGDPFSSKDVWKIIDYLYEKEIAFDIYTNGQNIINDVEVLAGYYPRLVGLSIYSGIPEDHDKITRIKGSQKKTIFVMEKLSALGVPMNLKCCVMRPNLKSYFTVKEIAKRCGAVPQFDINITNSVDGDTSSRHLRLTSEMMEVVLRDSDVALFVSSETNNQEESQKSHEDKLCGAGNKSFCITPEGNVQPCCAFPFSFGNISEHSLSWMIQNSEDLHWLRKQTIKDFDECGQHDYCPYCQMCPGNNYNSHGTPLKASENNCDIARVRYNLTKKMKEGYDPLKGKSLVERLQDFDTSFDHLQREESINYRGIQKRING